MTFILKYNKIKSLICEMGYTEKQAKHAISELRNMDKDLKKAFLWWIRNNEEPTIEIEGVTHTELMENLQMNPIAAFLFMDWLKKDPVAAKRTIFRSVDHIAGCEDDSVIIQFLKQMDDILPKEKEDEQDIEVDV